MKDEQSKENIENINNNSKLAPLLKGGVVREVTVQF